MRAWNGWFKGFFEGVTCMYEQSNSLQVFCRKADLKIFEHSQESTHDGAQVFAKVLATLLLRINTCEYLILPSLYFYTVLIN